jgi:hypothetical protein
MLLWDRATTHLNVQKETEDTLTPAHSSTPKDIKRKAPIQPVPKPDLYPTKFLSTHH